VFLTEENAQACNPSVEANDNVKEKKQQKPAVVFGSHTLVDPNTMMIKLLNTMVAHLTMLAPCRLFNLASRTFVIFCVHHFVKLILLLY